MSILARAHAAVCRAYSRKFVMNRPADGIFRLLCSLHFYQCHSYWPNFVQPRSFSEKIWHRMLYDRDPVLTRFADKLAVREIVRERIGENYLIPVLWNGKDADQIPFQSLPDRYVIKATHGSGFNILVDESKMTDRDGIRSTLKGWLATNYCDDFSLGAEWCYRNVPASIIIEEFIGEKGQVPLDYKFFCFNGRVEYIQIDFGRFVQHTRLIFDRDFNRLDLVFGFPPYRGEAMRPSKLPDMLHIAEALSRGRDFVRVDLYTVSGRVFFGEMTNYPEEGSARFQPRRFDFEFGEKWALNENLVKCSFCAGF
jgi:hypothetical protein